MNTKNLLLGAALAVAAAGSQAGVIIDSINVRMASTNWSLRSGAPGLGGDNTEAFAASMDAFNNGSAFCDLSLAALDGVSSQGTCAGGRRNFGALYTISGSVEGMTEFQFGLDWGRGGFIVETLRDGSPVDRYNDDIWWNRNWSNADVRTYTLLTPGAFSLTLLGFEDCCDGINSGRYRSLAQTPTGDAQQGIPGTITPLPAGGEWQRLEVNAVPLPGTLPLLAMGGLLAWRRGAFLR